ncbi:Cytochrome P450 76A2 [Fusarium odoratissimum]|uniref:Cytochrome P450 76A2 n=1 Tax=Fusarium oxysporum f. sp. cubense (strain race 4) TaxID=2502994 RepID=N1S0U3_FUSC4|nr:Cytochrome P450 76A2 [Fusarium odoratissimum]
MSDQVIYLAIIIGLYVLYKLANSTDQPKIKGIPEIPGVPLFGNLIQLGTDHARVAQKWAKKYGPVFQTRLGTKRVIYVNSYEAVKHFWITHQSALISRPMFHTFHSVVSSSQGFTIGTSPWDESCKNRRKAAATALNRPAVQSYMPILDLESLLLHEITYVEREISNFRSTSNNWQDYVPLLRLWGAQNSSAEEFRVRRDKYLSDLLANLKSRIDNGTDKPCITGNILKDPTAKLNDAEIKSICLTMVSAGLDTVPGNVIMGIAYLATEHGQKIQAKALKEIYKVYPNGEAWERCLVEEKVPYVTALVKEILRFWTVIPICLPRESIKDIPYQGAVIPAGTKFFMNAYAADYDETRFANPYEFNPERYIDDKEVGTPHYAYGAGSRMCAGSHLANRELYTAFIRLITAFEILPPKDKKDFPVMDCIECNANPTSLTTDPKPFKVGFKPRDETKAREWIAAGEERTQDIR